METTTDRLYYFQYDDTHPQGLFDRSLIYVLLLHNHVETPRPEHAEQENPGGETVNCNNFTGECAKAIAERNRLITERDEAIEERDEALQERDEAIRELYIAIGERNEARRLLARAQEKLLENARDIDALRTKIENI